MNAKNILIACLAVIILFTFGYMLICLSKSVGKFSAQFDNLSKEQTVSETESDEEDVEMEWESTSAARGAYRQSGGTSGVKHTSSGSMRSSRSTGDSENMDAIIDEIIRMAAEAGIDPIDFLDSLLAETNTGSKSSGRRTATRVTIRPTGSRTSASGAQIATGQTATPPSLTTTVAGELTGDGSSSAITEDEYQRLIAALNEAGTGQESPEEDVTSSDEGGTENSESTEEVESAGDEEVNDEG